MICATCRAPVRGTVGIGTVVFALTFGPLIQFFVPPRGGAARPAGLILPAHNADLPLGRQPGDTGFESSVSD
jgi:hypothetical protein